MSDRGTSTFQRGQTADLRQRNREEMQHGVVAVLDKQKAKFEEILPDTLEWSDFRSCFITAVQRNWRLLDADRDSLWLALQDCALAGLRPDGKDAALVIFGDDSEDEEGNVVESKANAKKKVQLLPMTWGLCRLVHNTGLVADIRARIMAALDAGVPLRDVQIAARHADPRTTTVYDRRRENFARHAAYVVVAFVAGG